MLFRDHSDSNEAGTSRQFLDASIRCCFCPENSSERELYCEPRVITKDVHRPVEPVGHAIDLFLVSKQNHPVISRAKVSPHRQPVLYNPVPHADLRAEQESEARTSKERCAVVLLGVDRLLEVAGGEEEVQAHLGAEQQVELGDDRQLPLQVRVGIERGAKLVGLARVLLAILLELLALLARERLERVVGPIVAQPATGEDALLHREERVDAKRADVV